LAQLQALGGVKPFVNNELPGQYSNPYYKQMNMILAWPIKLTERFSLEPSVGAYNVLNFANFNTLSGLLSNTVFVPGGAPTTGGAPQTVTGTANSTVPNGRESLRTGTGSGVFSQGAPRQLEFGLKLNF
jgi:hypothetical protein